MFKIIKNNIVGDGIDLAFEDLEYCFLYKDTSNDRRYWVFSLKDGYKNCSRVINAKHQELGELLKEMCKAWDGCISNNINEFAYSEWAAKKDKYVDRLLGSVCAIFCIGFGAIFIYKMILSESFNMPRAIIGFVLGFGFWSLISLLGYRTIKGCYRVKSIIISDDKIKIEYKSGKEKHFCGNDIKKLDVDEMVNFVKFTDGTKVDLSYFSYWPILKKKFLAMRNGQACE